MLSFGRKKKEEKTESFILYDSNKPVVNQDAEPQEEVKMLYNLPVSPDALSGNGKIIAVQCSSGGDGASTVAANLSAYFAISNPERVLLMDIDGYGTIRGRMGILASECLNSIIDWEDIFSVKDIHKGVLTHSSGVMLIPGVLHYDQEEKIEPSLVLKILTLLKREYEYIIVDCPPVSSLNNTWAVALVADLIINVFSPDRTSIDFLQEINGYLLRLGCSGRTIAALNKAGIPGGIRPLEIEKFSSVKIASMLPYSVAVAEANNKRRLLTHTNQRDEFAKAIENLAEEIPDILGNRKGG